MAGSRLSSDTRNFAVVPPSALFDPEKLSLLIQEQNRKRSVIAQDKNAEVRAAAKAPKKHQDGWAMWQETNDRLVAKDRELQEAYKRLEDMWKNSQEGWATWQATNDRLVARDQEIQELYRKLEDTWKNSQEGWAMWKETNDRLVAGERQFKDLADRFTALTGEIPEASSGDEVPLRTRSSLVKLLTWLLRKLAGKL
jgi:hypothetical protein